MKEPKGASQPHGRVRAFLRRHREALIEAIGMDAVYFALRMLGLFGAGAASAAIVTVATQTTTYHPAFSLSVKGAAFITRYEGSVLHLYNDPYNCTIGVGHLVHMGVCTAADYKMWPGLTQAQATTMLMHDAGTAEGYVRSSVTHEINQPQFDALVSFTFNVGGGGLQSSSALRNVNAGTFDAVPGALARWSSANGHFLPGLYARRQAEGRLFTAGDYGPGLGVYVPPKPTLEAQLQAETGYWSWLAWRLGVEAWKPYGKANPRVRPHVPAAVPAVWWRLLAVHVNAKGTSP